MIVSSGRIYYVTYFGHGVPQTWPVVPTAGRANKGAPEAGCANNSRHVFVERRSRDHVAPLPMVHAHTKPNAVRQGTEYYSAADITLFFICSNIPSIASPALRDTALHAWATPTMISWQSIEEDVSVFLFACGSHFNGYSVRHLAASGGGQEVCGIEGATLASL